MLKKCFLVFFTGLISYQACAVKLASNNEGEILIFPLLYAESGQASLIRVQNLSDQAMAAKAVVRHGIDGQILNSFNLYLASNDSWSAAFFDTTGSGENFGLVTRDSSCIDAAFDGVIADGTPIIPIGSGQAWLELFAMGALSDEAIAPLTIDPKTREDLCDTSINPDELNLLPLSNPLSGNLQMIDVLKGFSFSIPVTALNDFGLSSQSSTLGNQIPSLADAEPAQAVIANTTFDFATGLDAVNAALSASELKTPYSVERFVDGRTDLILTFPTRHLSEDSASGPFIVNTDPDHAESGQQLFAESISPQGERFGLLDTEFVSKCTPPPPPLTKFGPVVSQSQLSIWVNGGGSPTFELADTEPATVVSPLISTCGPFLTDNLGFDQGLYRLIFSAFETRALDGTRFGGLPVIPLSISTATNGTLLGNNGNDVLSSYGWLNQVQIERE